jgi:Xaa-Pro aminopeptidase
VHGFIVQCSIAVLAGLGQFQIKEFLMFQHFEDSHDAANSAARIQALRATFGGLGVDGVIIPRSDEHQGEYVAPGSERLKYITGFSGSAGAAIILKDRAILFVDGRYTIQAAQQTDANLVEIDDLVAVSPTGWLEKNGAGLTIGFDPWLHTAGSVERLSQAAKAGGFTLKALDANPVDAVWPNRPPAPKAKAFSHPEQLAGASAQSKCDALSKLLAASGADAAILSDPSSLAWAFNMRGRDIPHVPVALGFAVLQREGRAKIYLPKSKFTEECTSQLTKIAEFAPRSHLIADLITLAKAGKTILADPASTPEALMAALRDAGAKLVSARDPVVLLRAQKNATELEGARLAQRRDGAAMVQFLAWLEAQKPGTMDEITAAKKLEEYRRKNALKSGMKLEDISFDTISGSGPNGAIVHYRVTESTNRTANEGELFLIDSGGQYLDGTTDITRTVPIGMPTDEMRRAFTLVLKGMIAISRARFPAGTRGVDLDVLARRALWEAGLDYAHGTGHGVGSFLSVHEGPQSISKRGMEPLLAGMILSNEPGYYKTNAFGIRIENLVVVEPAHLPTGGEIAMNGFETLTLCPIDRRLIETHLLERAELQWLDAYHARVWNELSSLVTPAARNWLKKATKALPKKRR